MSDWFDPNFYGSEMFPPDDEGGSFYNQYEDDEVRWYPLDDDPPQEFWFEDDFVIFPSEGGEILSQALSLLADITDANAQNIRGQQFQTIVEAYEWLVATRLVGFSRIIAIPGLTEDDPLTFAAEVGDS